MTALKIVLESLPGPHVSGYLTGRITSRRIWAPGLMSLVVDAAIEPFAPGQFVNLALELEKGVVRRAYSLASPPGTPLEFLLTEVSAGALTPALFHRGVGDPVLVERKAQGFFTLSWVPAAQDLWMMATGTGLAPFLSILRHDEVWRRFEKVVLVHGVRQSEHLVYAEDLEDLMAARAGHLIRVPMVSREPERAGVLHGRVTTGWDDGSLERAAKCRITPERSHVMLCGNPAMIDQMTERLSQRGLRRHRVRKPGHITVERYWD